MKLSILIPTIKRHTRHFTNLLSELRSQILPHSEYIEIIVDAVEDDTIGTKRNRLLETASGKYLLFIDSDDEISTNYISLIMEAIESDCDCASLKGIITFDGKNPEVFEHSLKYDEWKTNPEGYEVRYERYQNHLNLCRSSIAKQFRYPEINHGEDHVWSKQVHESGLLKTEHYIPDVIYFYKFITNKNI